MIPASEYYYFPTAKLFECKSHKPPKLGKNQESWTICLQFTFVYNRYTFLNTWSRFSKLLTQCTLPTFSLTQLMSNSKFSKTIKTPNSCVKSTYSFITLAKVVNRGLNAIELCSSSYDDCTYGLKNVFVLKNVLN